MHISKFFFFFIIIIDASYAHPTSCVHIRIQKMEPIAIEYRWGLIFFESEREAKKCKITTIQPTSGEKIYVKRVSELPGRGKRRKWSKKCASTIRERDKSIFNWLTLGLYSSLLLFSSFKLALRLNHALICTLKISKKFLMVIWNVNFISFKERISLIEISRVKAFLSAWIQWFKFTECMNLILILKIKENYKLQIYFIDGLKIKSRI